MRLRLRTGRGALFGALLLAALIASVPMRLALGAIGADGLALTAGHVGGSVWDGRLDDARVGGIALGDVDARLSPLSLLIGEGRIGFDARGAAPLLSGHLALSRHAGAVEAASGHLDGVRLIQFLPPAAVDLDALSVRFVDGRCSAASGRVRVVLGGVVDGIALPTLLSGAARCDGAALLLPLAGPGGASGVTLRIEAGGVYRARIVLQPGDAASSARLAAAGFVPGAGGWQMEARGRF